MASTSSPALGWSDLMRDSVHPVSLAKWSQTTLGLPAAAFVAARASLGVNAPDIPSAARVPPASWTNSRRLRPLPRFVSIGTSCTGNPGLFEKYKKGFYLCQVKIIAIYQQHTGESRSVDIRRKGLQSNMPLLLEI